MRSLKSYYLIALLICLTGCAATAGMFQPLHTPVAVENEDAAVKAYRLAHNAIDEANAELTSLNRVIASNAMAGVWTKSQAQGYLNQSKDFGKKVDKAREAMRLGDLNDANVQATALKALIVQLQIEVAKKARKE